MKKILFLIILFPLISFSQVNNSEKDSASEETKKGMDGVFLPLIDEMGTCKGDFSITTLDTLKKNRKIKIKEVRVEKLKTSGDTVSYSMVISISNQTETLSIIRNRPPDFWYGYRIERNIGYKKDRYQSGYINNVETLDSLLIPIVREFALVKAHKEKDKIQEETLVSK